ncbi:MAG: TIGR00730 family Rossman fold protein [Bacteroidota bacterium]
MKRICVYCSSSDQIAELYFEATRRLARILVKMEARVVFGGGKKGLMGCLADEVLAHQGTITGIMPEFMREVEMHHQDVEDFLFTPDMHSRKQKLLEDTDALIALPGGCGTLEELMEAITLKRLGRYLQPIIIVNTGGYYDPLVEMLNRSIEEKFMHPKHGDMWTVIREPEELPAALSNATSWGSDALNFATM